MNRITVQNSGARIDWEVLPSLRSMLRGLGQRNYPVWSETLPSAFDPPCESAEFEEVVPGLAVREVREPEIFAIFFG